MQISKPEGIVIGSFNARLGIDAAIQTLRDGGSAIDAAVAAVRCVEDDPNDHSVGTSGIPNILGQVELDASLMDGRTLASGAVGAVKGFRYPIEMARRIMETMPHVMLVGEGAELFGRTFGFEQVELLTPEVEAMWRATINATSAQASPVYDSRGEHYAGIVRGWVSLLHKEIFGTTNVIVRDRDSNLASAVSTSGWGYKWPGRLGDSPIIGAGNYADNRYGAVTCTGRGELAIRVALAYSVVRSLREGVVLDEAAKTGIREINALSDTLDQKSRVMNIVAMDHNGQVAAASNWPDSQYVYQTTAMDSFETRPRLYVPFDEENQAT